MRGLVAIVLCALALPALAVQHHLLIVSGIGGLDEFQQQFDRSALELYQAGRRAGIAEDNLYLLSSAPIDGAGQFRPASLDGIRGALADIGARAGERDRIFVVLIGHGNPRGDSALFNLSGPDLSAEELAGLLARFETQTLVIVNAASASGPFVKPLAGANRVVITATSSGREYHAVLFGERFVGAFGGAGADRNKDERISMLEAFDYARREVRREYESEKRLLTEHALLEDSGDGVGSLEPGEFKQDGALADSVYLEPPPSVDAGSSPQLVAMITRKTALEQSISALKRQRDGMPRDSYYAQLETLLIDLALLSREIRAQGD